MKGVNVIIATILVIAISIAGITIVLYLGSPAIGRLQEINLYQEGFNTLTKIDDSVRDVTQEGEGSTRVLKLSITDGEYSIDVEKEAVLFSMRPDAQIIGIGVSNTEDNINILGAPHMLYLNLSYDNIDITGSGRFGKGQHNLYIRNMGYNSTIEKQIIRMTT